ncbi:MAG TPA: family 20 glycosylhydrolase [Phycisphaerales bacterium]|nr:family 20 glycosylhydrolase [Phycisphaerales bacterium]
MPNPDPAALDPLLIPYPRSLTLTGGTADLSTFVPAPSRPPVLVTESWSLPEESRPLDRPKDPIVAAEKSGQLRYVTAPGAPESYRLEITADEQGRAVVTITAADIRGHMHALRTFLQLRHQYATTRRCPTLVIEDAPAFATRGVMLDVSRDRVPTNRELARLVGELGWLKINHLQLYTEHTFAYAGHEDVWRAWSPLTPDDIRTLDALCRPTIELAANQNCFGHLASWLRHPKYADIAETHGDWVFDVWPRSGPFSLCPTDPRSIALIKDLLGQLLPCFTSPLVNIGCDETYDIAYGRSKDEVARRGRAAVYLDFVRQICEVAKAHGKRPMFWADIALSHPECVNDIPEDLISLAWGYEPESPFARWCDLLQSAGREVWVCPGTSSWRSITGRTTERRGNIDAAASAGRGKATGFLVCDWGDTGHHQQWPIALHGIAYGAAKAWNPDAEVDLRAVSLHVFGDRSLQIGQWLDDLGDTDIALRRACGELSAPGRVKLPNQSALFIDMFKKLDEQSSVGRSSDWLDARDRLEEIAARKPAGLRQQLDDELNHTLAVARFAAARASGRRQADGLTDSHRSDLRHQLQSIIDEHRRLWLLRSREGGLDHSCGFYRKIEL